MLGSKKQDFWPKINILKGNHCILRKRAAPVHQKLCMIFENKVVQKLKLEKNVFTKNGLLNWYFDIENWLWSSPFFSKDFCLVDSQRGPEFLHVKSQWYLQKLPLFNALTLKNFKNNKDFWFDLTSTKNFYYFSELVYFPIRKQPKTRCQGLKSGNFCK